MPCQGKKEKRAKKEKEKRAKKEKKNKWRTAAYNSSRLVSLTLGLFCHSPKRV